MLNRKAILPLVALSLAAASPIALLAQYTTPHTTDVSGPQVAVLGSNYFVNQGLVGVGRIPAATVDTFGETFGSVSGLQITNWTKTGDNSFGGVFNILPDRGYNVGDFSADYAARIQQVPFSLTPYTGSAPIGGGTFAEKMARQNQVLITGPISGTRLTYLDPLAQAQVVTTGLEPAAGTQALFGNTMPYVLSYTGPATPTSVAPYPATTVNRLTLDSEALILLPDGSGYVGDEYGAHVYYFNAAKQIVGAIVPPDALRPRVGGVLNFRSTAAPTNGRRNNQGFEGVGLSPDRTRLFVLLQSAAVQDANSNAATRLHTRLLVYDVSSSPTPTTPIAEYVLTLPTYLLKGDGSLPPDSTAAQSEVIALDTKRILVLSRDGNGLGNINTNPSVFKSVLLVDTSLNAPSNIAGSASDSIGGKVTTTAGNLDPSIKALTWTEAVNLLNTTQLGRFNIALDTGVGQVSQLTLGEKWEGMALMPAMDPAHPHDYFLFVANDNDFLTATGTMRGPSGLVPYDGFSGYPATRLPANAGAGNVNANDTMFLVYRVTYVNDPTPPTFDGLPTTCSVWPPNSKMVTVATISASDALSGLAPGSFHVTVSGDDGAGPEADVLVTTEPSGSYTVAVRAKRSGGGQGRTYTIEATATDNVGNVGTATASCIVPHDQGR